MYFWSKRTKTIFLILFLLFIWMLVNIGTSIKNNRMMFTMHFCNSYDSIISGKQENPILDITDAMKFDGCTVPYASVANTFYISQDMTTDNWNGYFQTNEGYEVYFLADELWKDKLQAISENHIFSLLVVSESEYRIANLVVSGLPVISLTETVGIENPSEIVLIDMTEEGASYEGRCTFHLRGQTTTTYPKQGYKVELCDEELEEVKTSLLGLRKDDDWILNPMYTDSSKVREKLAYQIWDDIQTYNQETDLSSNITYVELILNNAYWGIYGVMEPVDEKQLSLNETDLFYRKTDLVVPEETDFYVEDQTEYIPGFRIKYPKLENVESEDWLPLQPYVEKYYYDIYSQIETEMDISVLSGMIDVDNIVDYEIFLAVISGSDNIFKNIDYVLRYENGGYVMHMVPWDMDNSLGNKGVGAGEDSKSVGAETCKVSREFITLYRADSEWMENAVKEKWKKYRESFLSLSYLQGLVNQYMTELNSSGAMARDNNRWPECNGFCDPTSVNTFLEEHINSLDAIFESDEWWRANQYLRRAEQWDE